LQRAKRLNAALALATKRAVPFSLRAERVEIQQDGADDGVNSHANNNK
jgi:hypothetical protein